MDSPTPLQSLIGGIGVAFPIHSLLLLNGAPFGISGFFHRGIRGDLESAAATIGLILGGVAVASVDGQGPELVRGGLSRVVAAGLLVGAGTKLGNGCTSGHMLCGVARFSTRSTVATATFFLTAVVTSLVLNGDTFPAIGPTDWSLGPNIKTLLALQAVPLTIEIAQYCLTPSPALVQSSTNEPSGETTPLTAPAPSISNVSPLQAPLRILASFVTAFHFAIPLRISGLVSPTKIITFLLGPLDRAFDPSLAFVAIGGLPLTALLYHCARPRGAARETPRLGGKWSVPKPGLVDAKLLAGAVLFGLGWGMCGICPGPGLVNLGRDLATGTDPRQELLWLAGVAAGGFLV